MFGFSKFQWKELVVTNNQNEYTRIVDKLMEANISYRDKVQYIGHGTRQDGSICGFGENKKRNILYQVFVKKSDIEQAKYICMKK